MLLGASGAWLSHTVGRHEDRPFLMTLTAMHQLGVAVSQGGIIQLGLLWRLVRRQPDEKRLWPLLLRRTSEGVTASVGTYWSDYNHNVSGLFIVIMAILGLASQTRWAPWARCWPLGFIALGVFIVLRSDAQDSWPFGHMGFWEGILSNDEILLHRLGALIACVLGLIEWQARANGRRDTLLAYVIPLLCAMGGLLLLGHMHAGFQLKEEFLIQMTHHAIGLLAVIMACGRWLELRLTPPAGRLGGAIFMSALLVVGLILLFYRETPVSSG